MADISLKNFEQNVVKFETNDFSENLRCIVGCTTQEILNAKELGFSKIVINISLDPSVSIYDLLKSIKSVLQTACINDCEIYLSIDNALESPLEEIDPLYSFIAEYKIKRLILGDINGKIDPFTTYDKLNLFMNMVQCPIEYKGCNDYGMATANTLSALRAGVRYVATSVSGIGVPGVAAMSL